MKRMQSTSHVSRLNPNCKVSLESTVQSRYLLKLPAIPLQANNLNFFGHKMGRECAEHIFS